MPASTREVIAGLSESQWQQAERRRAYVARLEACSRIQERGQRVRAIAALVRTLRRGGVNVSRPSLYRWAAAYREKGLLGLVDGRTRAHAVEIAEPGEDFELIIERLRAAFEWHQGGPPDTLGRRRAGSPARRVFDRRHGG